jgi:hypothetical protein
MTHIVMDDINAESVHASHRNGWHQDSDSKLSRPPYWHLLVVFLETDASLAKAVGSRSLKNTLLKSDVLDLTGANNAASKL